MILNSSHAPRGNSYKDAPASRDAERQKMHSHAGAMGTIHFIKPTHRFTRL